MSDSFSARRRNYMLSSHRRDALIEFIKELLHHSFVLNNPESYRGEYDVYCMCECCISSVMYNSRDDD